MQELMNHIQYLNVKARYWMNEGENRWSSMYIEDPEWWAEQNVFTIDDFEVDGLRDFIWEVYKSQNGFRPRHMDLWNMGREELQSIADDLAQIHEEEEEYESEYNAWLDAQDALYHEELMQEEEFAPTKYEQMALDAGYAA